MLKVLKTKDETNEWEMKEDQTNANLCRKSNAIAIEKTDQVMQSKTTNVSDFVHANGKMRRRKGEQLVSSLFFTACQTFCVI